LDRSFRARIDARKTISGRLCDRRKIDKLFNPRSLLVGFSVPSSSVAQLGPIAQTPATDARKTEADQLFQQGIQQFQTSQFEAALQSWETALKLYRQIKDRLGEGQSLGNLGLAYYALGNYAKAIDYHEGLSRSFIAAGVPSVVVSLWAVPDNSTATLMTQFYKQLKTNPDKAQALRQAMLHTMKQHPKPRAWAAFTLIGEAR
jgi:tetratricopeptide (TPR) repeat protein